MIPAASSITHQHILAVINTETAELAGLGPVRILNTGCGGGVLLAYLSRALPALRPGIRCEVSGFDVHDHGVQQEGFKGRTPDARNSAVPGIQSQVYFPCVTLFLEKKETYRGR